MKVRQANKTISLEIYVISPDGVTINLDLRGFNVGDSFFVPCINTFRAKVEVLRIFRKRGWEHAQANRREKGAVGLRFWRTA